MQYSRLKGVYVPDLSRGQATCSKDFVYPYRGYIRYVSMARNEIRKSNTYLVSVIRKKKRKKSASMYTRLKECHFPGGSCMSAGLRPPSLSPGTRSLVISLSILRTNLVFAFFSFLFFFLRNTWTNMKAIQIIYLDSMRYQRYTKSFRIIS